MKRFKHLIARKSGELFVIYYGDKLLDPKDYDDVLYLNTKTGEIKEATLNFLNQIISIHPRLVVGDGEYFEFIPATQKHIKLYIKEMEQAQ